MECLDGEKLIIDWQYSGEKKQRIFGATDYSLKILKGQDCSKTYAVTYHLHSKRYYNNDVIDEYTGTVNITGKILDIDYALAGAIPPSNFYYGWYLRYQLCNGSIENFIFQSTTRRFSEGACYTKNSRDVNADKYDSTKSFCKILNIIPADGSIEQADCLFQIFSGESVVYQKTTPECPDVNMFCDGGN